MEQHRTSFYSRNRDKLLAYQHKYNADHKEQRKAYDRQRYLKRKTEIGKAKISKELVWTENVIVSFK